MKYLYLQNIIINRCYMNDKKLCIIIPCGGYGKRLNIPIPKELFPIKWGTTSIDNCFKLFNEFKKNIRIIVVINSEKLETVRYLKKYSDDYDIIFKYQKSNYQELIGAINSVQDLFLEYNLVMLPDTFIIPKDEPKVLLQKTMKLLDTSSMVFWVKKESDKKILANEGAVLLEDIDNKIIIKDYLDKPGNTNKRLNGYWGAFAFKSDKCKKVLEFMKNSIEHRSDFSLEKTELRDICAIELIESIDLGTWDSIYKYFSQCYKNERGNSHEK